MEKNNLTPERDWRALAIYQIMVGSFVHSDKGAEGYDNMWGPEGERKDGNLRGVISALDHIAGLGVNAIWLTPIFDSSKADGGEKLQATGYFANDYFSIDPHFGTDDDLRELIAKAHERGLYVLLDGVFGHHDGVRVGDSFYDGKNEINLMTRFAILAGYPGPVTIYYGDEFADLSRDCDGAQPDNASRTTGHLKADDARERRLADYVRQAMTFRRDNPAMWRGTAQFDRYRKDDAEILTVIKTDPESDNRAAMIFADRDTEVALPGDDTLHKVRGYIPLLLRLS